MRISRLSFGMLCTVAQRNSNNITPQSREYPESGVWDGYDARVLGARLPAIFSSPLICMLLS